MNMREWMLELREREGRLTPAIVLEAARPPDSPAHQFVFHVDAQEAAESYYLERAHKLIRSVRVTVETPSDESPRRIRFFHYVTDDDGDQVYEPLPVIVESIDKFDEVRKAAMQRLNEAQEVLADLELVSQQPPRKATIHRARTAIREARELVESA